MALTNAQLLAALSTAIRSADHGGNTSAADVRGFLTDLLAHLQENSEEVAAQLARVPQLDEHGQLSAAQLPSQLTQQLAEEVVHRKGDEQISGNKYFLDHLGIGTTSPTQKLTIADADTEVRLGAGCAGQTPAVSVINTRGGKAAAVVAGTVGTGFFFDKDGVFSITATEHATFVNNNVGCQAGVDAVVVNGAGKVGIAQYPGSEALEVNGSVKAAKFIGDGSLLSGVNTVQSFTRNGSILTITTDAGPINLDLNQATLGSSSLAVDPDFTRGVANSGGGGINSGQWYQTRGWTSPGPGIMVAQDGEWLFQDVNVDAQLLGNYTLEVVVTSLTKGTIRVIGNELNAPDITAPGTYQYPVAITQTGQHRFHLYGNSALDATVTRFGIYSTNTVIQQPYGTELFVHKTGDETIAGNKQFTSPLAVSTTANNALSLSSTNSAANVLIANLLAANFTDNIFLSIGQQAGANGQSGLFGFSLENGAPAAFITTYGRPASDFKLLSTGNIGMGTSTPSERLEVIGNVKAAGFIGDGSQLSGVQKPLVIEQSLLSNAATSIPSVAAVNAAFNALVNGAPTALDTLKEIADQLAQDERGVAAILATQQQLTQQLASNVVHITGSETITGTKTFIGQLRVNYSPNQDALYFKGGPGRVDSLASIAFDATTGEFGRNVSARYTFRDDGLYGAHHVWETKINRAFDTLTQEKMRLTRDGNLGVGVATPTEKVEVAGNVKAIRFVGDGSQLTNLPVQAPKLYATTGQNTDGAMSQNAVTAVLATKADLVDGKIAVAQLPTRDPYAIQDNATVVAAVTGGTYTNGELQASSQDYATATGALVAPGDRIMSINYVHEYCRLASGSLGWVRWAKS